MKIETDQFLVVIAIILIVGCFIIWSGPRFKKNELGCVVKGTTIKDDELCQLISSISREQYELGKLIGESCNDEIIEDIYNRSREFYIQKYSLDFKEKCLLIITNGKEPQQSQWYQETNLQQFNKEHIFPIRSWDLELDQIEGYGDDWNGTDILRKYYILCD